MAYRRGSQHSSGGNRYQYGNHQDQRRYPADSPSNQRYHPPSRQESSPGEYGEESEHFRRRGEHNNTDYNDVDPRNYEARNLAGGQSQYGNYRKSGPSSNELYNTSHGGGGQSGNLASAGNSCADYDTKNVATPVVADEKLIAKELGSMSVLFYIDNENLYVRSLYKVLFDSFLQANDLTTMDTSLFSPEEGYNQDSGKHYSRLMYKGKELMRAESESTDKAREEASLQLINKLAMTGYTIKARPDYFSYSAFQKILGTPEVKGVYRMVPKSEVPSIISSYSYMNRKLQEQKEVELIFGGEDYTTNNILGIQMYADQKGYNNRRLYGHKFLGVSLKLKPQHIRENLLAKGSLTHKFELIPPQGDGNNLLEDIHCTNFLPPMEDPEKLSLTFGHTWSSLPKLKGKARGKINGRIKNHKMLETSDMIMETALSSGVDPHTMQEFQDLPRRKRYKVLKKLRLKGMNV